MRTRCHVNGPCACVSEEEALPRSPSADDGDDWCGQSQPRWWGWRDAVPAANLGFAPGELGGVKNPDSGGARRCRTSHDKTRQKKKKVA